ncbi:MAG: hypothetical protein C4344_00345, partial [Acidimicrobiia bacterium]
MFTERDETRASRLERFEAEVRRLRVGGGSPGRERHLAVAGAVAMVVGVVLGIVGWAGTRATESQLDFADYSAMARCGIALTTAGGVVFTVMSLRRWLRYWLF